MKKTLKVKSRVRFTAFVLIMLFAVTGLFNKYLQGNRIPSYILKSLKTQNRASIIQVNSQKRLNYIQIIIFIL